MMRSVVAVLVGALVAGSPAQRAWARGTYVVAPGETATGHQPTAEGLYEEGRKAYRLGKFKDAIEKWEQSYALSESPRLLYNISLAHKSLYEVSLNLEDLLRARAVLKNFIRVAEADASLAGDVRDAQEQLRDLEAELKRAQERSPSGPAKTDDAQPDEGTGDLGDDQPTPEPVAIEAPRPQRPAKERPSLEVRRARGLQIGGGVTLGLGAAMLIAGIGVGAYEATQVKRFKNLANYRNTISPSCYEDLQSGQNSAYFGAPANPLPQGCVVAQGADVVLETHGLSDAPQGVDPARYYLTQYLYAKENGPRAQKLAVVGFAALGTVGLAATVVGAVLLAKGTKDRKAAKQRAQVRVMPTFGGLVVTGRF